MIGQVPKKRNRGQGQFNLLPTPFPAEPAEQSSLKNVAPLLDMLWDPQGAPLCVHRLHLLLVELVESTLVSRLKKLLRQYCLAVVLGDQEVHQEVHQESVVVFHSILQVLVLGVEVGGDVAVDPLWAEGEVGDHLVDIPSIQDRWVDRQEGVTPCVVGLMVIFRLELGIRGVLEVLLEVGGVEDCLHQVVCHLVLFWVVEGILHAVDLQGEVGGDGRESIIAGLLGQANIQGRG